jgi:hypothetical protein
MTIPISPSLTRLRDRLYRYAFTSILIPNVRQNTLLLDGVRVGVKIASGKNGKWKINLHCHGRLDESSLDAYLFVLNNVPGNAREPLYLLFPAPQGTTTFDFTFASLTRLYSANIDDWDLIHSLSRLKGKMGKKK